MASQVRTGSPPILNLDIKSENKNNDPIECLSFSSAYNLTGFETIKDKVLLEMDQRTRSILHPERAIPDTHSAKLSKFAEITKSPPINRYTAVHNHEFNLQPSIAEDYQKRANMGQSSPPKRLRTVDGGSIGISPTKKLELLSLNDKAKINKARQIKQKQMSPKRRSKPLPAIPKLESLNKPKLISPVSAYDTHMQASSIAVNPKTHNATRPTPITAHSKNTRPISLPKKETPSTMRSFSRGNTHAPLNLKPFPQPPKQHPVSSTSHAISNEVPSYARPTLSTLRRSQSIRDELNEKKKMHTK